MTKIVWSTESVDSSAMLLSQGLEDALFTKGTHETPDEGDPDVCDALVDTENQVVFYGVVALPEWFVEDVFDNVRMFNDPRKTRALLTRQEVIAALQNRGVRGLRYIRVRNDTSYQAVREVLGPVFDMVVKTGMTVTHTIRNSEEFYEARAQVHYACTHVEPVLRARLFLGHKHLTHDGLIGMSVTERKQLSFYEQLTYNSSADVKQHVQKLFDEGILSDEMREGEALVAWTEEQHLTAASSVDTHQELVAYAQSLAEKMQDMYGLDFWSVDVVKADDGHVYVTNMTASPSLQNDDVLHMVTAYIADLTAYGRTVSKEHLVHLIQNLSDEQIRKAAKILRTEGVFAAAA